ncbi:DUF2214 domain-containing protein [Rivibacter subsaxonicus]|uniref:Uncharacterized protein n=1 Tax=Rivibacter subsaxonicus TaxID=457575 RepID=A0A4Q7VCI5_9BURK|nr:DUF2214 domain-containing protein [Rivibacter subsaxonicus]RZT92552.1 hypothetical protein EV670_3528 [Rivibacter subsaxonicus]
MSPSVLSLPLLATAVEQWPLAVLLRESRWLYPLVSALHISGIAALFGSLLVLDLRLLGLHRNVPLTAIARCAWPVAVAGLALALVTGPLLLITKPTEYIANPALAIKFVLIALAFANVAFFHARFPGVLRGLRPVSLGVRISAAASLLLWWCVMLAGRAIAFL